MTEGIKPPSGLIGYGETKKRQEVVGSSPLRKQIGQLAVEIANDSNRAEIIELLISPEPDSYVMGTLLVMSANIDQVDRAV